VDTLIIYCGDCLDQLSSEPRPSASGPLPKLPDACIDLIYVDPPFNSNRNYEVFWGDLSEPRPSASGFLARSEDRHASTQAYIDYMRPRCVELSRALNKTGSFTARAQAWHRSAALFHYP
jgi:DNA modification methylase